MILRKKGVAAFWDRSDFHQAQAQDSVPLVLVVHNLEENGDACWVKLDDWLTENGIMFSPENDG